MRRRVQNNQCRFMYLIENTSLELNKLTYYIKMLLLKKRCEFYTGMRNLKTISVRPSVAAVYL